MSTPDCDLLVVGAGAGGMTTALSAALMGMKVILCETSEQVGGTTATSAGTIWVPGNHHGLEAGFNDSVDAARTYLDAALGASDIRGLRHAYLSSANDAINFLESRSEVRFATSGKHPDYLELPGAAVAGRAISPLEFDGRRLRDEFARIRPPMPEFLVLGGMMAGKADVQALIGRYRSLTNFTRSARLVLRYARDRLRHPRGTRLVMGNALVARLFFSLRQAGVDVRFGARLQELDVAADRVIGATFFQSGKLLRLCARAGVVLATGGVGHHPTFRASFGIPERDADRRYAQAAQDNQGDGLAAATAIGAKLERHAKDFLWQPVSVVPRKGRAPGLFPHLYLDRAKPGLIAVNSAGRRFVNEGISYHHFVEAMVTQGVVPAWLVCDTGFVHRYGLGRVAPGERALQRHDADGYLVVASTIEALARRIGVDGHALIESVTRNNQYAIDGIDPEFGKGSDVLSRFNGDANHAPNPCLGPIERGPFCALAVWPGESGSSSGLATTCEGAVIDAGGQSIPGLYACGNDMASIMHGHYPGPGITIGPAMVFGWRIAKHASTLLQP